MRNSVYELLVLCIVVVIAVLVIDLVNRARIRYRIRQKGGKVIRISRQLFAPGWFGEKVFTYGVKYSDRENNVHAVHCRIFILGDVYLANDSIIQFAPGSPNAKSEEDDPYSIFTRHNPSGGNLRNLSRQHLQQENSDSAREDLFVENERLKEEIRLLREELERLRR